MGLLDFFRRNKNQNGDSRREILLKRGRITDGTIIDCEVDDQGREVVQFAYSIHGVDFEASEILTEEQRKDRLKYAPGASVAIRFDPKNQGNAIVV